jgi:hypothetical protein
MDEWVKWRNDQLRQKKRWEALREYHHG